MPLVPRSTSPEVEHNKKIVETMPKFKFVMYVCRLLYHMEFERQTHGHTWTEVISQCCLCLLNPSTMWCAMKYLITYPVSFYSLSPAQMPTCNMRFRGAAVQNSWGLRADNLTLCAEGLESPGWARHGAQRAERLSQHPTVLLSCAIRVTFWLLLIPPLMEGDNICFIFLGGKVHICLEISKELSPPSRPN